MMIKKHVIIIGICAIIFKCTNNEPDFTTWKSYQGDYGRNQYSDSINELPKHNIISPKVLELL